jgi:hypothetical protein
VGILISTTGCPTLIRVFAKWSRQIPSVILSAARAYASASRRIPTRQSHRGVPGAPFKPAFGLSGDFDFNYGLPHPYPRLREMESANSLCHSERSASVREGNGKAYSVILSAARAYVSASRRIPTRYYKRVCPTSLRVPGALFKPAFGLSGDFDFNYGLPHPYPRLREMESANSLCHSERSESARERKSKNPYPTITPRGAPQPALSEVEGSRRFCETWEFLLSPVQVAPP